MPNTRGQYAKGVAKRREILAAALEVVAERGCRKASNREIAERVGLSQAGLLHYFASREEMYVEVLRARDERDSHEYWTPEAGIEAFFAIIAHNIQVRGLVQLFAEYSAEASVPDHPAHEFFLQRHAWVSDQLAQSLRNEQAAGTLGPQVDIPRAVDLLIATADGTQVQWLVDPDVDMVGRVRYVWELICRSSHA